MSRYLFRLVPVLCLLLALVPDIVEAIPAFARRYELPCHFCHDGFPKLSVLGEQFKERGFRLENDKSDVGTWIRSVPVSVRGAFRQTFEEKGDADSSALVRLVTAGDLGSRVSYWLEDNYVLDSEDSRRVGLDNAFVRVEVLPDELYVRGGRIELDLPFTQTRTPQLFRYEIYFANTGFESDNIASTRTASRLAAFSTTPPGGRLPSWTAMTVKSKKRSPKMPASLKGTFSAVSCAASVKGEPGRTSIGEATRSPARAATTSSSGRTVFSASALTRRSISDRRMCMERSPTAETAIPLPMRRTRTVPAKRCRSREVFSKSISRSATTSLSPAA